MPNQNLKNFLAQIIFIGVLGAAVAFGYSLTVKKIWRVTGKIVIVPSASSPTAGQNLSLEAANTSEMISGASFQKFVLEENAAYFADARPVKSSSTVIVSFKGEEDNINAIEDIVVKLPENISNYTRDIYNGAPFKYLLASDPEISSSPVRPNLIKNVFWGFGAGALAYFLYWLYFSAFFDRGIKERMNSAMPKAAGFSKQSPASYTFSPDLRPMEPEELPIEKTEREITPEEIKAEYPSRETKRVQEESVQAPSPALKTAAAPPNLPVAADEVSREESTEPTDEEVKERLNRLMRGEL